MREGKTLNDFLGPFTTFQMNMTNEMRVPPFAANAKLINFVSFGFGIRIKRKGGGYFAFVYAIKFRFN